MQRGIVLALTCIMAVSATAQTCFHLPGDTPGAGAADPRPFGTVNRLDPTHGTQRYQLQIPHSVLGTQPIDICEIFVAPAGSRRREFRQFSLRLGHNPSPITTQMVFNMPGFTQTVVGTDQVSFPSTADQWLPVGMTTRFRHLPANGMLVLEFFVREAGAPTGTGDAGLRTDPGIPFVWTSGAGYAGTAFAGGGIKLRFCTDHHGVIEYGTGGCAGSDGRTPRLTYGGNGQIGSTLAIDLANARVAPGTLAVLVFSFRVRSGPFDLVVAGAPDCNAYVFGDAAEWLFTSTGALSLGIPLPATLQPCFPLWNQWFVFDPNANQLGVVSSNYGRVMLGS